MEHGSLKKIGYSSFGRKHVTSGKILFFFSFEIEKLLVKRVNQQVNVPLPGSTHAM